MDLCFEIQKTNVRIRIINSDIFRHIMLSEDIFSHVVAY